MTDIPKFKLQKYRNSNHRSALIQITKIQKKNKLQNYKNTNDRITEKKTIFFFIMGEYKQLVNINYD